MKRRLELIMIVLCLTCGLLACGEKKGKDKSSESAETTENVTFSGKETESPSPEWVAALSQAKDAKQLFVICAHGTSTAWVSMHEKDEHGKWKMIMSTPGFIGRNGLGKTKEGDGMTPVGTFSFNRAFGIADDPGCAIPYVKVDDDYYWSGDVNNGMHYNELVKLSENPGLNVDDSEHIVDYAYEYRYCLNISYNDKGTAGLGSAIFLHCFGDKKPYTGGCVAIPEEKMKYVMQKVSADCVVVIDSFKNLGCSELKPSDVTADAGTPEATVNGGEADPAAGTEVTVGEDGVKLSNDPSDFAVLSEAVPDAILEIRYYSTYNFVGDRIDGYEQPIALLTKEAAKALKEAGDELKEKGYRLKIFDAYRPQMAVTNFMNWALDTDDTRMKEYFYPELEKDVLFPEGYIAEHSGHSRGSTVDLTLFDMRTGKEVDMGGTFDYFGELSHPDYKDITKEQYANRMLLRDVMIKHGFKPLEEEWWHFTLENEPYPDTYFTFPINGNFAGTK